MDADLHESAFISGSIEHPVRIDHLAKPDPRVQLIQIQPAHGEEKTCRRYAQISQI